LRNPQTGVGVSEEKPQKRHLAKAGPTTCAATIRTVSIQIVALHDGSKDLFVHISAVEQAGLRGLTEGQKIGYDLERGQQGKTSAVDLRAS